MRSDLSIEHLESNSQSLEPEVSSENLTHKPMELRSTELPTLRNLPLPYL